MFSQYFLPPAGNFGWRRGWGWGRETNPKNPKNIGKYPQISTKHKKDNRTIYFWKYILYYIIYHIYLYIFIHFIYFVNFIESNIVRGFKLFRTCFGCANCPGMFRAFGAQAVRAKRHCPHERFSNNRNMFICSNTRSMFEHLEHALMF